MKNLLKKWILINILAIALSGYSQQNDTLCFSLKTAKQLAFYRVNFDRLNRINKNQKELIKLLKNSNNNKVNQIVLLQKKDTISGINFNLQQDKLKLKPKKTPFLVKLKWFAIGVGMASFVFSVK